MQAIHHTQIRRHKLYMMYRNNTVNKQKQLTFFKYMGKASTDSIFLAICHGKIYQSGNIHAVTESFWRGQELLPTDNDQGTSEIYEITFDEFAHHVVAEII